MTPTNHNPMKQDRKMAADFIEALTGDPETPMLWLTFPDRDEDKADPVKRQQLTRVIYGSLSEVWEETVALNNLGAGIFITVNQTGPLTRKTDNRVSSTTLLRGLDDSLPSFAALPPVRFQEPSGFRQSNRRGCQKGKRS